MSKKKEAFEKKIEAQLKQMSDEIQRLLDQVDEAEAELGTELLHAIEKICDRWTDAERERNRVRIAGEDGWQHLQYRFEAALRDVKLAMEPAIAHLQRSGAQLGQRCVTRAPAVAAHADG